jgi:excinuclease ABC subunit C
MEDYAALAQGAVLFLEGKNRDLVKTLRKSMADSAKRENYEEAARFRDLIRSVEVTVEKQKMVVQGGDIDVLGYYREGSLLGISLLFIRGGNLIGSRNFALSWEMDDEEGFHPFSMNTTTVVYIYPMRCYCRSTSKSRRRLRSSCRKKGQTGCGDFPRKGNKLEMVWPTGMPRPPPWRAGGKGKH